MAQDKFKVGDYVLYVGPSDTVTTCNYRKALIGQAGMVVATQFDLEVMFPLIQTVIPSWQHSCRYLPDSDNLKKITEEEYAIFVLGTLGEAGHI